MKGDLWVKEGDLWKGLVIYWKMKFLETSSGEQELVHRDLTSTVLQFFFQMVKDMVTTTTVYADVSKSPPTI